MIHSTWNDEFIKLVEAIEPSSMSIWYLGGNGFIVRSAETTVYIDPYFGDGDPPFTLRKLPVPLNPGDSTLCDAVLVTHEHIDHMHPPSIKPLVDRLDASVYAPKTSFKEPEYGNEVSIPEQNRKPVNPGDEFVVGDLTVYVEDAFDDDSVEPVSYVIEHDKGTFFHGGDTKPSNTFNNVGERFDIDLGALALGTKGSIYYPEEGRTKLTDWYMDEHEVLEVTSSLRLNRLIPTHHDLWKGVTTDPKILHEHIRSRIYPELVEIMEIGDRVNIDDSGVIPPTRDWSEISAEY